MNASANTHATLLTPPGAGAIAVVRVDGPGAGAVVDSLFKPASLRRLTDSPPGRLRYGRIVDGDETLDDVVACVVSREPHGVIELCLHGGVRVVERVLAALESRGVMVDCLTRDATVVAAGAGARFDESVRLWSTENAIEREIDTALESAKTERAVRFLADQRCLLSGRLRELAAGAGSNAAGVRDGLRALMRDYRAARRLIDGATVVILGPPNSGKSTLFNRLAGRNAAIVSPVAGTTRDWVSATVELDGIPVTLIDTAGERVTPDELEAQAIRAGRARRGSADAIIHVEEASVADRSVRHNGAEPQASACAMPESPDSGIGSKRAHRRPTPPAVLVSGQAEPNTRPSLEVINKVDLIEPVCPAEGPPGQGADGPMPHRVSALTGAGVNEMMSALRRLLSTDRPPAERPCLMTDRQMAIASEVLLLPITDTERVHTLFTSLAGVARGNGRSSCL